MLPCTSRTSSVRGAATSPSGRRRYRGAAAPTGATDPWNSGDTTGSSRRRRASGDRSCQRTLCGATRRSVDSVTLAPRRHAAAPRRAGSRSVLPCAQQVHDRADDLAVVRQPAVLLADEPVRGPRQHGQRSRYRAVAIVFQRVAELAPCSAARVTVSCRTPTMCRQRGSAAGQRARAAAASASSWRSGRSASSGQAAGIEQVVADRRGPGPAAARAATAACGTRCARDPRHRGAGRVPPACARSDTPRAAPAPARTSRGSASRAAPRARCARRRRRARRAPRRRPCCARPAAPRAPPSAAMRAFSSCARSSTLSRQSYGVQARVEARHLQRQLQLERVEQHDAERREPCAARQREPRQVTGGEFDEVEPDHVVEQACRACRCASPSGRAARTPAGPPRRVVCGAAREVAQFAVAAPRRAARPVRGAARRSRAAARSPRRAGDAARRRRRARASTRLPALACRASAAAAA